jgi:hypothetical protein
MVITFACYAVILVGFERNFSLVFEDDGSFELCVRIFTNPTFFPSHVSVDFSLNLITLPGTAGMYVHHNVIFCAVGRHI